MPVYIVMNGRLSIMVKDDKGNQFEVHSLRCGDAFGYSDFLKIIVSVN